LKTQEQRCTREVAAIVERICPLLAGHSPHVQGAALADLLALWLAGHHVEGDAAATRKMREALVQAHMVAVARLTKVNAKIMGTTP
jgi:hypothetical protein